MASTTWDLSEYTALLRGIEGRLADLAVIDAVAPIGGAGYGSPRVGGPAGFGYKIGTYYPFTAQSLAVAPGYTVSDDPAPTFPGSSPGPDPAVAYVAQLSANTSAWAHAVVEGLAAAMKYIATPLASEFKGAASKVEIQLSEKLAKDAVDDFGLLAHSLADWHGDAANQFADYVYGKMQAAVQEQQLAAEAVRAGLTGSYAIVTTAQTSLMSLVSSVHDMLDDQLQQRQADHTSPRMSAADWLAIAAGVAGVLAAIPTGGASLGAADIAVSVAGASSAILSTASSLAGGSGETRQIQETTAADIASQLTAAYISINDDVNKNWTTLDSKMERLQHLVQKAASGGNLWPARPAIADGVTPATFHHESVNY